MCADVNLLFYTAQFLCVKFSALKIVFSFFSFSFFVRNSNRWKWYVSDFSCRNFLLVRLSIVVKKLVKSTMDCMFSKSPTGTELQRHYKEKIILPFLQSRTCEMTCQIRT